MPAKQSARRSATWTAAAVFAAALALTALLGAPRPAQALTVAGAPQIETAVDGGPADGARTEEAQPPFGEEDECEGFEEEDGSGEEDEGCEVELELEREGQAGADGAQPPEECLLRSARARLVSSAAQSRIKLAVQYTAFAPTDAYVDYKLIGARGTLTSAVAHQRLAGKGAFNLSRRLDDAEMEKAQAARRVIVFLDVPGAPPYCRPYETRHLTPRQSPHSQVVWLQSGTIFGTNP
jgi:hypothetical protein